MKMKHFPFSALFCTFLCLLTLFACKKSDDDSVVPDKGKNVLITVREQVSSKPLLGRSVGLYTSYIINYPSYRRVYTLIKSLGETDANGQLIWNWPGDVLEPGTHIGVSGEDTYYEIIKSPEAQYLFLAKAAGEARLRITMQKDSLPCKGVYLLELKTPPYYTSGLDAFNEVTSFRLSAPFDTTIIVSKMAPYTNTFAVRYNVDASSLAAYLNSGTIHEPFTLSFYPLQIEEKHIVIK